MCNNTQKKLCIDKNCKICFKTSFASSARSKYWNNELNNGYSPRQFHLNSHKKFWFDCETCKHTFDKSLNDITNKTGWCSFCGNRRLCDNKKCVFCFEKSFASHHKSKFWNNELNRDITPRQIRKNTQKNYWFNCDGCNHSFEMTPNNVNYGAWCIYCAHLKLCDNENCKDCFDKSFASINISSWSNKNEIIPRNVFKNSTKKCWVDCNKCNHSYLQIISRITRGDGCHYCSCNKLCDNEKCDFCFNKSFANNPKSEFWHKELNGDKIPRQYHLNSNKKFWFNCNKCNYEFDSTLLNISTGNNWCPMHKNITEKNILDFLEINYQVEREKKFNWCKNIRYLPFDFYIDSLKVIIELDGAQHFRQISNWRPYEETQKIDFVKMHSLLNNGYKIIRLLQEDVKFNKYNWKDELLLNLNKPQKIILMCKNDEYKNFKLEFKVK
jgi:very-short-patch-repair endonuclease